MLNRFLVGLLTLACVAGAGVVWAWYPDEIFWWGGLIRAALVLVVLWFCLPTRSRPAAWEDVDPAAALLIGGAILLAIFRPRIGLPLLGAIALYRMTVAWWRKR